MCVHKTKDGICRLFSNDDVISYCVKGPCDYEASANADKTCLISDEGLVNYLFKNKFKNNVICRNCPFAYESYGDASCKLNMFAWLKQAMEE